MKLQYLLFHFSLSQVISNVAIQGARTSTLIVPWLFAVKIVGLSLFQQTALMKYEPASSSLSSKSEELNLCQAIGFDIACK